MAVEKAAQEKPSISSTRLRDLELERTELVFGFVAPIGTELAGVESLFGEELHRHFGYSAKVIRLSEMADMVDLSPWGIPLKSSPEHERIRSRIDACNTIRQLSEENAILAMFAAHEIRSGRRKTPEGSGVEPTFETAYLLHSLKHPDEVKVLREIYGPGFFCVGTFTPESLRLANLVERRLIQREDAIKLIDVDAGELPPSGQHTRDAFEMADVFIPVFGNEDETRTAIRRFLGLVFGNTKTTPTLEEHCMFLAFAAALRSGSLSRQVGAAIANARGDVMALGANDAPRFGGGQYWPGDDDARDSALGIDHNDLRKRNLLLKVTRRALGATADAMSEAELLDKGGAMFEGTGIDDITEYSRETHAEMAALLECARLGIPVVGLTLFSTTFPCHNCAKHIVTAGVSRVIFVEPYPKSLAQALHRDSVSIWDGHDAKERVQFIPFMGIGPRRFFDLFSLKLSSGVPAKRKNKEGRAMVWGPRTSPPRMRLLAKSYLVKEAVAASELNYAIDRIASKRPEVKG